MKILFSKVKLPLLAVSIGFSTVAVVQGQNRWDNNLDFGATVTKGNSDSMLLNFGIKSELKAGSEEYNLNLFYTYGENLHKKSNDQLRGDASIKHFLNSIIYLGARIDFNRDDIAGISYRTGLTNLAGIHFIKEARTKFRLEGGLGATTERQAAKDDDFVNFYLGEFWEHTLLNTTKFYQNLTLFAPVSARHEYNFIFDIGVKTALTDTVSLNLYIQSLYDAAPSAGIEKNDLKFVTGISYKF